MILAFHDAFIFTKLRSFVKINPCENFPIYSIFCLFYFSVPDDVDQEDLDYNSCTHCLHNQYRMYAGQHYNFAGTCRYVMTKLSGIFEVHIEMPNCDSYTECKQVNAEV